MEIIISEQHWFDEDNTDIIRHDVNKIRSNKTAIVSNAETSFITSNGSRATHVLSVGTKNAIDY